MIGQKTILRKAVIGLVESLVVLGRCRGDLYSCCNQKAHSPQEFSGEYCRISLPTKERGPAEAPRTDAASGRPALQDSQLHAPTVRGCNGRTQPPDVPGKGRSGDERGFVHPPCRRRNRRRRRRRRGAPPTPTGSRTCGIGCQCPACGVEIPSYKWRRGGALGPPDTGCRDDPGRQ